MSISTVMTCALRLKFADGHLNFPMLYTSESHCGSKRATLVTVLMETHVYNIQIYRTGIIKIFHTVTLRDLTMTLTCA